MLGALNTPPDGERRATNCETLRLAGIVNESVVDGPGLRTVIFVQGCPHHCPGCHNPETWPADGGYETSVDEVWGKIKDRRLLRGVTFSGGEPFLQAGPLAILAEKIKQHGWDLMIYTGYTWEELNERRRLDAGTDRLLALGDILVDGPFIQEEKDLTLLFRGSRNQRLIDLGRSAAATGLVLWQPAC